MSNTYNNVTYGVSIICLYVAIKFPVRLGPVCGWSIRTAQY